jgi:hypothetical protein
MNSGRISNRRLACHLILATVLVLGIVQWSFLPILVQSAPFRGGSFLELSNGHTSKFAAPFKCLLGSFVKPCVTQTNSIAPSIPSRFLHRSNEPTVNWRDVDFSYRQFRAPPTA